MEIAAITMFLLVTTCFTNGFRHESRSLIQEGNFPYISQMLKEQKKFLTEKFQQGERSGRKSDPASVARSMMSAVDSQEKRMFSGEEFLTASQVAEFFPRLAAYKQCQGVTLNYNYKARQQESNGKIN
ncbi:uncharacterized protein LOC141880856 isoform X1 [Acropora palmata]|uniref:uncharacterized protein LOC141880856 isoform X1 n=1 Tax=Acropora palmata TaxID=6131 RepID=UPI003DA0FA67